MNRMSQRIPDVPISRRRLVAIGRRRAPCWPPRRADAAIPGARCCRSRRMLPRVTFWTPGGSPTYCEVHTEIAADYKAVNPNVTVNFQCGTDPDAFTERLLGAIAAGNPPDATVYWDTPVSLGVRGALLPLDELMASAEYAGVENWPAGVLASCQFDGQTWGLPVAAGTYGIWYNQELFEAKGHPERPRQLPQDVGRAARSSRRSSPQWDGDRLETAGFVSPATSDLAPTLPIWSALNGGQLYDAANQALHDRRRAERRDDGVLRRLAGRGVQGRLRPGPALWRLAGLSRATRASRRSSRRATWR